MTTYTDRRGTGDTSMRCDAHDDGARCDATAPTARLHDIGGDEFVGDGVRFVVKHRLCTRHRDAFARGRILVEHC
jgi:hypothetical protein